MIRRLLDWWRQHRSPPILIEETQWQDAEYALPFLDRLTPDERQRLRELAGEFIATKQWHGAHGMPLSAAMQLSIALQACLPILNLGLTWYRGWIGIVVYPGDFVIPRQIADADGVVHEYDDPVLGEAWEDGPVLLSWFDNLDEIGDVSIVIHEFAHKLDMSNGAVDGLPALHTDMSHTDWIDAFSSAYADFCRRIDAGEATEIDPYAAEHPSEFFAVASEVFFEAPELLIEEYPAVYRQLALFFRQDPLSANKRSKPTPDG